MAEKRFYLNKKDNATNILDIISNNELRYIEDMQLVVDLLNNYEKDNQRLKEENKELLTIHNMKKGALVKAVDQLTKENEELYENDKILRQRINDMSLNYQGVAVKRELFRDVLEILKEIDALDLYYDLYTTTIDMGVNGALK